MPGALEVPRALEGHRALEVPRALEDPGALEEDGAGGGAGSAPRRPQVGHGACRHEASYLERETYDDSSPEKFEGVILG